MTTNKKLVISTFHFLLKNEFSSIFATICYFLIIIIGLFINDDKLIFIGTVISAANVIACSIKHLNRKS